VVLGVLLARLSREEIPRHVVRQRLLSLIATQPGLHRSALASMLGLHRNTITQHLRKLVKHGFIKEVRRGRYVCYRIPDPRGGGINRGPCSTGSTRVMNAVLQLGYAPITRLSRAAGMHRITTARHVQVLAQQGLVRIEKHGRHTYVQPTYQTFTQEAPATVAA
jgi:DNA-binding IclR family transcriptional regulator